jgi:hypothetical protein
MISFFIAKETLVFDIQITFQILEVFNEHANASKYCGARSNDA